MYLYKVLYNIHLVEQETNHYESCIVTQLLNHQLRPKHNNKNHSQIRDENRTTLSKMAQALRLKLRDF